MSPDVFKYLTCRQKHTRQRTSRCPIKPEVKREAGQFSYFCAPLLDSAPRGQPFLRLAETASQVLGMKIQNIVLCLSSMPGSVSEEGRWTSNIKTLWIHSLVILASPQKLGKWLTCRSGKKKKFICVIMSENLKKISPLKLSSLLMLTQP